jgi:predicted transcriptional regulator
MVVFKVNPTETGLQKTLKEYEEIALRYTWSVGEEGAGSGKTWERVNDELGEGKSISKASVIFYLNRMVDEGVLGFRDATGKGGHHRIYITKLDESGYKKYIVRTLLESRARAQESDFPQFSSQ